MKKLWMIILVTMTLAACNSGEAIEGVSYEDKIVIEITLHQNWQSNLFFRFNNTKFISYLRTKSSVNDRESMTLIIDVIKKTEDTTSFEFVLINSDYDVVLAFDDETTKKYALTLNSEGEEGVLVVHGGSAFRIPVEETNVLRELIGSIDD
ncbi:hypothetical protein H1D32_02335 [Anaerobacillus sp. CMMVII]|uniref:hypothetical protein n=1 Tax=Anaerobacillus sp. CMMVII TaxID=2755588 RepID=UPI0021B72805|nr:hypothetical protein [Anaerobacillus sp. CMMVII]MCT8136687.1 hypothetical protein [Anaerobacillus sp. CMMVII]